MLRDCFTAGYTLPQFCIDEGIKNPLFVAPNSNYFAEFWNYHIQFSYDKRISAKFAVIEDANLKTLRMSPLLVLGGVEVKNISEVQGVFDAVFIISTNRYKIHHNRIFYLDKLTNIFVRRTYVDIPLKHFLQNHKGIKLFVVSHPLLRLNKNTSDYEKKLLQGFFPAITGALRDKIKNNPDKHIPTPYDFLGYTNAEVYELTETPPIKTNLDGSTSLQETENKFLGIKNGKRQTANQPEHFKNTIHFVGDCVYFGIGVPWQKTVESHLQKMLNENNLPYRVENESQWVGNRAQDMFYTLNNLSLKQGDIVFFCWSDVLPDKFPFIDVIHIFERPHNYGEVFADSDHINELGHKALAEKFFQFLTKHNFFQNVEFIYPTPPPDTSLRYSERKFFRNKFFAKSRTRKLQKKFTRKKNSCRRDCYELQSFHARSRIFD